MALTALLGSASDKLQCRVPALVSTTRTADSTKLWLGITLNRIAGTIQTNSLSGMATIALVRLDWTCMRPNVGNTQFMRYLMAAAAK